MPSMVPTPRTHTGVGSRSRPQLEIIPNTRFIVFNGGEHEAAPVKLSGVIRLTTPDAMSILKPRVRLEGKRKISWWYMGGISAGEVTDKRAFWNEERKLGVESAHKIKAGAIEWPFEFELSPSMPESVEGLKETYIVYHLHAAVSRPGWNAKDVVAQEHIRLVRTLGQDSMEMTRSRVNADIWANKISYSISIPTDAIVFGTSVTADVELSPIKKGIKLGKVELRMMETVVKRIQSSEVPDARGDRSKSEECEVAKADMEFPEHARVTYDDETADNPTMADEMYRFKATLQLPKSLNACRQDTESHQINISHRFKLMVNIHNPEGHVSQLVCRLPVKLFISPNLPVDESNQVCPGVNPPTDETINSNETTLVAPPEYGRHQLDQIFSDIDPTGYMSAMPSNPGTPAGLSAQSRRASQENLASLNGMANGVMSNSDTGENHGSASPSILHSRLTDLQIRGRSGSHPNSANASGSASPLPSTSNRDHSPDHALPRSTPPTSAFAPHPQSTTHPTRSPPTTSAPLSRRTSNDSPPSTTTPAAETPSSTTQAYNMSSLSRVPSYNAALRTPHGAITPYDHGPPSYLDATSRPPSPGLQRPGPAHVRTGASSPGSDSTLTGAAGGFGGGVAAGVSGMGMEGFTPVRGMAQVDGAGGGEGGRPRWALQRGSSVGTDEGLEDEARLRMLRART